MTIYLSGPITGTTDYKSRFSKMEKRIKRFYPNAEILNPVKFCSDIPKDSEHKVFMIKCIEKLKESTHIIMMADWQNSKGCQEEYLKAIELGLLFIPV